MYTRSQKHVPRQEIVPAAKREVEYPQRVDKSNLEAGFSLGYVEPEGGRYNTMSRRTYGPSNGAGAGRESRNTILNRKERIEGEHRSKHFFLGTPEPYTSENRSALAPPPSSAFNTGLPPSVQNRKNALAMNTANFYMNNSDEAPTSTLRQDFKECDVSTMQTLRSEAAGCRAVQQKTNYSLGNQKNTWSSEARETYGRGRVGGVAETKPWLPTLRRTPTPMSDDAPVGFVPPKRAANQNLMSQFTLGSSDLSEKGGMKTLKQVDYVSHPVTTSLNRPHQVEAQRDQFVFGHRGVPINSLYRESFPPTQFAANPSPTPPRRL